MSLQAISAGHLQSVRLRKADVNEAGAAHVDLGANVAQERAQNAQLRACDLEAWYTALAPWTFRTALVPISMAEARAVMR
jgi:hypothetical protein